MKNVSRILLTVLTAVLLLGAFAYTAIGISMRAKEVKLPILSIETKREGADSLDFLTEPVSRIVSKELSSIRPDYIVPPEPYYEECRVSLRSGDGELLLKPCNAKVKVRGNWTTYYPKKSLRIKFSEKQNLLGLNGGAKQKNWVLLAEYKDASMLRDKAALYISREILAEHGLYAADADFVQVEVNGNYYGLYLLADMQQVSDCRIDITEPPKGYTRTDIGYFLEYDGYYTYEDELNSFPLDFAGNAALRVYTGDLNSTRTMEPLPTSEYDAKKPVGMTIKSDIYSQEQHDYVEAFINNVYRIMYEAAYHGRSFVFDEGCGSISETDTITPQQAVENVVDIQSLVDMYIISELTCDADLYWSSFFLDVDFGPEGSKILRFEAPWDFDSSMGNRDRCLDGTGFYACNVIPDVNGGLSGGGEYDTINPWLVVLAYEDWYQERIRETWTQIYDSGVFERCDEMITADAVQLRSEFNKNYAKWDNIRYQHAFEHELSEPAKNCRTEAEAAEFLRKWLDSRVSFLNSQWHT